MLSASSCSSSSKIIALVGVPGRRFELFPIICGKCMKFNMLNQFYSRIKAIIVQEICFLAGIMLRIRLSNQNLDMLVKPSTLLGSGHVPHLKQVVIVNFSVCDLQ